MLKRISAHIREVLGSVPALCSLLAMLQLHAVGVSHWLRPQLKDKQQIHITRSSSVGTMRAVAED
jgi:hypothetical protein